MKKISILLSVLLLAGCADAPDNVKNNSQSGKKEINPIQEIQYIPVGELKDDAQKALSYGYSNFTFIDGIDVSLPDEYLQCSFKQTEGFEENYQDILSRFFDADTLSKQSILKETGPDGMVSYSFTDESQKIYGCVGDNGFICFAKPEAYDNLFLGGSRVKIYHVDRNDDLSDSYTLDGEEVSVQQAADYAQKWLDENYADVSPEFEIKVKTIIARKTDDGIYSYQIFAEELYKGALLDSLAQVTETIDGDTKVKYSTHSILMQMFKKDEISSLTNGTGTVVPNEEHSIENIVSLTSAMGYLETTFTDFAEPMEISDINLKYTLSPNYDHVDNHQAPYAAGIDYDSRLVWEFAFDLPENELQPEWGNVQKYIYIDAESGELEYEFDTGVLIK